MSFYPRIAAVDARGSIQTGLDAGSAGFLIDDFGRLAVAEAETVGDYKHRYTKLPLFIDEVTNGTASSTWSASSVIMSVSAEDDFVVRKSKVAHPYQAGKAQFFEMTFDSFHLQAGVIKRVGYFSSTTTTPFNASRDGIYLESNGDDMEYYFVIAHGTLGETKIARADWDDPLYGIDFEQRQIMVCGFQWLGVGRVRFGFSLDGLAVPATEVNHANNGLGVYMLSPCHPLRYEIRSTGGAGVFTMICSTVSVSGGIERVGFRRPIETGPTAIRCSAITSRYGVLGVRLAGTRLNTAAEVILAAVFGVTNDAFRWDLLLNPTIAVSPTWSALANSGLEYFIGATSHTLTGGTSLAGDFVVQKGSTVTDVANSLRLGSTTAGVADILVLAVRPMSTNLDVKAQLSVREYI